MVVENVTSATAHTVAAQCMITSFPTSACHHKLHSVYSEFLVCFRVHLLRGMDGKKLYQLCQMKARVRLALLLGADILFSLTI